MVCSTEVRRPWRQRLPNPDHAGDPFAVEGHWYRGNLHCHSTNSMDVPEDRGKSPADVVAWYRDHGYDFVGITDHRVLTDTSAFATADFLTINSIETHNWDARGVLFDIVGVGVHSFTPSSEDCHPLPGPGRFGRPTGCHRPNQRRWRHRHHGAPVR